MKRITLQPSPLSITLDRCPADESGPDYLDMVIERGEMHISSGEVNRGDLPEAHLLSELSNDERAQVNGAILAEWLDWKPSDAADDVPVENILELFDRFKQSLIDGGVIRGEGGAGE